MSSTTKLNGVRLGRMIIAGANELASNKQLVCAHDGIRIILVDGFQLAAGLQDKASRNLSATDGGYQLFQLRNLTEKQRKTAPYRWRISQRRHPAEP